MLVTEVYNKAEWEVKGGADDMEGRSRKSEYSELVCDSQQRLLPVGPKNQMIRCPRALLTYWILL